MTKTTREMIEVMEAYERGDAIEISYQGGWHRVGHPYWNWDCHDYRIAPSMPDTINWDHVAPEYKWMARDRCGHAYLYIENPLLERDGWYAPNCMYASPFASYKRGTCDWKDSLVERPVS